MFGLVCISLGGKEARKVVHGANGNGGHMLQLTSILSDDDINYNREFQRMRYLQQGPPGNAEATSGYVLADHGITTTNTPAGSQFRRRAPHHKYY